MAKNSEELEPFNILLGCTGSVASLKIPLLAEKLVKVQHIAGRSIKVKVVATEHALHFFEAPSMNVPLLRDADEWDMWKSRVDPVLHIELRRWANVFVIAPLDANTLAKLANGICDNLLTCVARAWDMEKPLLFAPAMNTHMYNHPLTKQHITTLESFHYVHIPCVKKTLVCGDEGLGAMAEVDTIVQKIVSMFD